MDKKKYLTTKEVAELLHVKPQTISSYLSRSQMPEADEVYGSTPLWKPATIAKWIKKRKGGQ